MICIKRTHLSSQKLQKFKTSFMRRGWLDYVCCTENVPHFTASRKVQKETSKGAKPTRQRIYS